MGDGKWHGRHLLRRAIVFPLFSVLLIGLLVGCESSPPRMTFASTQSDRIFEPTFSQAYVARAADGDYEILLVSGASISGRKSKPGAVLRSTEVAPVRQFVDIRVFWRPAHGVNPNHPAATNAAIDWYLIGDPNAAGPEMLHYEGTASVFVDPDGRYADVDVRNATIKLKERRGDMQDVLGTTTVRGSFKARHDTQRLADLVGEMKFAAEGAAPSQVVEIPSGPPARQPAGP